MIQLETMCEEKGSSMNNLLSDKKGDIGSREWSSGGCHTVDEHGIQAVITEAT